MTLTQEKEMKLLETLKVMRNDYRKSPGLLIEFDILTLIVGEVETISKRGDTELSDAEVMAIITKLSKSVNESLALTQTDRLVFEQGFLSDLIDHFDHFAPKQMTADGIIFRINQNGIKTFGEAMKYLKTNCAGQYDGKTASAAVKSYFETEYLISAPANAKRLRESIAQYKATK